jgi:hypothetical protein
MCRKSLILILVENCYIPLGPDTTLSLDRRRGKTSWIKERPIFEYYRLQ